MMVLTSYLSPIRRYTKNKSVPGSMTGESIAVAHKFTIRKTFCEQTFDMRVTLKFSHLQLGLFVYLFDHFNLNW